MHPFPGGSLAGGLYGNQKNHLRCRIFIIITPQSPGINSSPCSSRGVSGDDPEGGARGGARGQASSACTREVPGPDRGALRPLRRELCWTGTGDEPRPRKRGPGNRNRRRWSAERRRASRKGARAERRGLRVAPFGAPSPRHLSGGKKAAPLRRGKATAPPRRKEQGRWRLPEIRQHARAV